MPHHLQDERRIELGPPALAGQIRLRMLPARQFSGCNDDSSGSYSHLYGDDDDFVRAPLAQLCR